MVCPACNQDYSDSLDRCPGCPDRRLHGAAGGPVEEAADAAVLHCTACGARALPGLNFCQQCGEPTRPGAEWAVGACLNCGATWHKSWQFCRVCGVSRANALLDETISTPLRMVTRAPLGGRIGLPSTLRAWGGLAPCARCGAELAEEVNYCNQCGVRVSDAAADAAPGAGAEFAAEANGGEGRASGVGRGGQDTRSAAPQESEADSSESAQAAPARGLSRRQIGVALLVLFTALLLAVLLTSGTQLQDLVRKLRALVFVLGASP